MFGTWLPTVCWKRSKLRRKGFRFVSQAFSICSLQIPPGKRIRKGKCALILVGGGTQRGRRGSVPVVDKRERACCIV